MIKLFLLLLFCHCVFSENKETEKKGIEAKYGGPLIDDVTETETETETEIETGTEINSQTTEMDINTILETTTTTEMETNTILETTTEPSK